MITKGDIDILLNGFESGLFSTLHKRSNVNSMGDAFTTELLLEALEYFEHGSHLTVVLPLHEFMYKWEEKTSYEELRKRISSFNDWWCLIGGLALKVIRKPHYFLTTYYYPQNYSYWFIVDDLWDGSPEKCWGSTGDGESFLK